MPRPRRFAPPSRASKFYRPALPLVHRVRRPGSVSAGNDRLRVMKNGYTPSWQAGTFGARGAKKPVGWPARLPTRTGHYVRRRAVRVLTRLWLRRQGSAPVLLTSIPKCGTHLLRELLRVTPPLRFGGELPRNEQSSADEIRAALQVARGHFVVGHIPHTPENAAAVVEAGARVLHVVRDPRAYVVSLVHHIRRFEDHALHTHFRDHVADLEHAAELVIRGVNLGAGRFLPDVATFFGWYLGWRTCPSAYTTTYEALVGPEGGGSRIAQRHEVAAILTHLGYRWTSPVVVNLLASVLYHRDSPTFRRGVLGDWRRSFTPRLRQAFRDTAPKLLADLGYEAGDDW